MIAVSVRITYLTLLGLLLLSHFARAYTSPPETLAGLTPGVSRLADATAAFGQYSASMPGKATFIVGGAPYSIAFRWAVDVITPLRGFSIEMAPSSEFLDLILVEAYPGLATSRGLTTLVDEHAVIDRYGLPPYAFEWLLGYTRVRELYYPEMGLYIGLAQVTGRPNWTVTKLALTYPDYLRNGVSQRVTMTGYEPRLEDITQSYRVWASLAIPQQ